MSGVDIIGKHVYPHTLTPTPSPPSAVNARSKDERVQFYRLWPFDDTCYYGGPYNE